MTYATETVRAGRNVRSQLWHAHPGGYAECTETSADGFTGGKFGGACPYGTREAAADAAFTAYQAKVHAHETVEAAQAFKSRSDVWRECECCGRAVFMFDRYQLHTECMARHDRHRRGLNASKCKSYGKVSQ